MTHNKNKITYTTGYEVAGINHTRTSRESARDVYFVSTKLMDYPHAWCGWYGWHVVGCEASSTTFEDTVRGTGTILETFFHPRWWEFWEIREIWGSDACSATWSDKMRSAWFTSMSSMFSNFSRDFNKGLLRHGHFRISPRLELVLAKFHGDLETTTWSSC